MPLVTCPDCGRQVSDAAPVCLGCGRPMTGGPPQQVQPEPDSSQMNVVGADRSPNVGWKTAVFAFVALGAFIYFGAMTCTGSTRTTSNAVTASPIPTFAAAPPPDPAELTRQWLARADASDWRAAFEAAQDEMSDTPNEDSHGTALLALWAARRMRWSDVTVPQDETTFALVRKDPDAQRGKRMCSSGTIIEIREEKPATQGRLAHGLFNSDSDHLYRFWAAGSTGALVEQSYTTFCGIVTGKFDYSNSAGGTGHAVTQVGMFDLPENRSAPMPRTVSVSDLPRAQ